MYNNFIHIVFLTILVLISSCGANEKEIDEVKQTFSFKLNRESKINKIQQRDIQYKISVQQNQLVYANTTLHTKSTFKLVSDFKFEEIVKQDGKSITNNNSSSPIVNHLNPIEVKKTTWEINITFDNDIFANRDYYFTNGFKIELITPFLNSSPINYILLGTKSRFLERSGFSLMQNMYTPTNPDTTAILYGDRPFAAYLMLGQFRETYNLEKKIRIKSELNIGIIGPSAYGQEIQSSIHEKEPVGWINQIENNFILSYSFQIDKGLISSPAFEFNLSGRTTLGTLYNKAGGGINLRAGNFMPVYRGPFSVFQNKNPGGRYQFWIFAEAMLDFIGFDATLQGGMFNKNNVYIVEPTKINRVVFEAGLGFALYYNNIGIEYKHYYLTPEFEGAYSFSWGQIKAVFAF